MASEMLADVFDPQKAGFLINDLVMTGDEELRRKRADYEATLCQEITDNLLKDVEASGVCLNYSIRILVNEIALNLMLLSRVKFYLVNRELIQHRYEHRPSSINNNHLTGNKTMKYEAVESKERIHPLYDDFVLKLEKAINQQLGLLGLLPEQQRELHKIKVIENYKKRLVELETGNTSYSRDLHIKSEKGLQLNKLELPLP